MQITVVEYSLTDQQQRQRQRQRQQQQQSLVAHKNEQ
jgi:hypothetical protein